MRKNNPFERLRYTSGTEHFLSSLHTFTHNNLRQNGACHKLLNRTTVTMRGQRAASARFYSFGFFFFRSLEKIKTALYQQEGHPPDVNLKAFPLPFPLSHASLHSFIRLHMFSFQTHTATDVQHIQTHTHQTISIVA